MKEAVLNFNISVNSKIYFSFKLERYEMFCSDLEVTSRSCKTFLFIIQHTSRDMFLEILFNGDYFRYLKGPERKYFRLCKPCCLCCNYLTLVLAPKQPDNMYVNTCSWEPIKLHLQNQGAGPPSADQCSKLQIKPP